MKHRLSIIFVSGLLIVACGSGDSETESADEPAATDEASEGETTDGATAEGEGEATDGATAEGEGEATDGAMAAGDDDGDVADTDGDDDGDAADTDDNTDDGDEGDDNTIVISDFDDIPDECVDLMGQFLREIEPQISSIDWQTATIAELEAMSPAIEGPSMSFDEASAAAGCDRYDIGVDDDQSLLFAIEVAEREAPGTVGWLEFIATFSQLGQDTETGDGESAGGDDLPTDCTGMLDYLRDLAAEYGTIDQVPLAEFNVLSGALTNLTSLCTIDELNQLGEDPVISAFLDG